MMDAHIKELNILEAIIQGQLLYRERKVSLEGSLLGYDETCLDQGPSS